MSRPRLWLVAFGLGMLVVLLYVIFPWLALAAIFLSGLLFGRARDGAGDRAVLSGMLIGFGALWLALLAGASLSGRVVDDATLWIAVGVAPLAVGLVLLASVVTSRAIAQD